MTTVRVATWEDEADLVGLVQMMHSESGILPLHLGNVRDTLARAFNKQGGIIGIIGPPGGVHAAICLMITRFWYTDENHIEELFNFVHPDHRKSNHATTLIEFAKKCSDEIHIAPETPISLFIGVLTNQRMAGKVRLYRRSLGYPAGAWFVHNARWQNGLAPQADDFRPAIETRSEETRRRRTDKAA